MQGDEMSLLLILELEAKIKRRDERIAELERMQLTSHEIVRPGECSSHPDAPHGFDRSASHSNHRYTCECEGWKDFLAINLITRN